MGALKLTLMVYVKSLHWANVQLLLKLLLLSVILYYTFTKH